MELFSFFGRRAVAMGQMTLIHLGGNPTSEQNVLKSMNSALLERHILRFAVFAFFVQLAAASGKLVQCRACTQSVHRRKRAEIDEQYLTFLCLFIFLTFGPKRSVVGQTRVLHCPSANVYIGENVLKSMNSSSFGKGFLQIPSLCCLWG